MPALDENGNQKTNKQGFVFDIVVDEVYDREAEGLLNEYKAWLTRPESVDYRFPLIGAERAPLMQIFLETRPTRFKNQEEALLAVQQRKELIARMAAVDKGRADLADAKLAYAATVTRQQTLERMYPELALMEVK